MANDNEIISLDQVYVTGIKLVDDQHKELVNLTNELYRACLSGPEAAGPVFKEVMSRMVEYVRFHFSAELELLAKIKYPRLQDHKLRHDTLVKQILAAAKEYGVASKFVPHNFVRTLKDWVFGHIAVDDREYSLYVAEQKSKGLLTGI